MAKKDRDPYELPPLADELASFLLFVVGGTLFIIVGMYTLVWLMLWLTSLITGIPIPPN